MMDSFAVIDLAKLQATGHGYAAVTENIMSKNELNILYNRRKSDHNGNRIGI